MKLRCGAVRRLWGQWIVSNNLRLTENDKMERAAAMWAAANQDDFDTARAAGNARTSWPAPSPNKPLWRPLCILAGVGQ